MSTLTLTILRSPSSAPGEHRQLRGGELTIGRGAECDWPLPDPLRSLSRKHCTVSFLGGAWQVRDLSGNGTFINFTQSPIGREMTQSLRDGDRLRLGDYEIEARIDEVAFLPTNPVPPPAAISPFGELERPGFAGARLPGLDDPVAPDAGFGFGARAGLGQPGPLSNPTLPDHGAASSDAFSPVVAPAADKSIIPADWYAVPSPPAAAPLAPVASSAPSAFASPFSAPVPAPAPAAMLRPEAPPADFSAAVADPFAAIFAPSESAPVAPAAAAAALSPLATPLSVPPAALVPPAMPLAARDDAASALAALLAGSDLTPELVPRAAADPEAALRNAGALLRAVVSGMRALLIARGQVKREFRIEQTMLRQTDNNPLKFAATDEYALAALLDPRTPAVRAVRESIDDLTLHQVATLAATQAAARALLEQLDPDRLESQDSGGGLLPGAREKRLWEAYKRRHAKLLEQFEDDFESAFGTAFARAYEQAASDVKKP